MEKSSWYWKVLCLLLEEKGDHQTLKPITVPASKIHSCNSATNVIKVTNLFLKELKAHFMS